MSRTPLSEDYDKEADEGTPLLDKANLPRFEVLDSITLRDHPGISADRTGEVVKKGTVVTAHDIVTVTSDDVRVHWDHIPLDETCYVLLGRDRGWAINRSLVTDEFLLEPYGDERQSFFSRSRMCLARTFQTTTYEYFIMVVILVNAGFIMAEIDFHSSLSKRTWFIINTCFAVIYVTEMSLKLVAFGFCTFLESKWNIFDLVITLVTVVGDVLPFFTKGYPIIGAIAPVLRLLRLLRLAKIFREIRALLKSLTSSVGALFWIFVFTLLWFYMSACMATVFVGQKRWLPDDAAEDARDLRRMFRNVPMSMYSLFEVMTLEGWTQVVRPLVVHRPILVAFFILFIFVTAFFLLNLITAVVVDRTMGAQTDELAAKAADLEDGKERVAFELKQYFLRMNNGMDIVERPRLERLLDDAFVKKHLEKIGWDAALVGAACAILDTEHNDVVSLGSLSHLMGNTMRPLESVALLRVQAEMTARLERQEMMLLRLLDQEP